MQDPNSIPQKGDRFQVPRAAFLTYWEDVLRLVQGDQVLRYIPGIQRLLFWTGFNGTRVFEGTALVPEDEIFGGGRDNNYYGIHYTYTSRISD